MARKVIAGAVAAFLLAAQSPAEPASAPLEPTAAMRLTYEVEVAALLRELRDDAPKGSVQLDNVRVLDPRSGEIAEGSSIIVRDGRVRWVGRMADAPRIEGVTRIDGGGRLAAPGLSDMHIHAGRADGWLLNLAAGVTTVREMDGFPWTLRAREQINAGRMLAPRLYVAGTIIASEPLFGYAEVAAGPADARRIVRQQAACGYDFIKVHNRLQQPMFDAVADQAARLGMDLVGHVPHEISLRHALQSGRMRTTEHLKGFLLDRTLFPSEEDYAPALAGTESWITPTLFTLRNRDHDWGRAMMSSHEARYVPPDVRAEWASLLARPDARELMLGKRFAETQKIVMARLLPLQPRWLTGTDAAGYAFTVMGFALLEELRMFRRYGLSPAQIYRASTLNAAEAMREQDEFGVIRKEMRADIVLLDSNPLSDVDAFRNHRGVMAAGRWIDRSRLDRALDRLAALYSAAPPAIAPEALVARLEAAEADGFVFDDRLLEDFAKELTSRGSTALAARVRNLLASGKAGHCAPVTPAE